MTCLRCVVCGVQMYVKDSPKPSSNPELELECCERCEHAYEHVSSLKDKLHNVERDVLLIKDAGKLTLAAIANNSNPEQMPEKLLVDTANFKRLWDALNLKYDDYPDSLKFQKTRYAFCRILSAAQDLFKKNPSTDLIALGKAIMYYKQVEGWTDASFREVYEFFDKIGVKYDNLTGHEHVDNEAEIKKLNESKEPILSRGDGLGFIEKAIANSNSRTICEAPRFERGNTDE